MHSSVRAGWELSARGEQAGGTCKCIESVTIGVQTYDMLGLCGGQGHTCSVSVVLTRRIACPLHLWHNSLC